MNLRIGGYKHGYFFSLLTCISFLLAFLFAEHLSINFLSADTIQAESYSESIESEISDKVNQFIDSHYPIPLQEGSELTFEEEEEVEESSTGHAFALSSETLKETHCVTYSKGSPLFPSLNRPKLFILYHSWKSFLC